MSIQPVQSKSLKLRWYFNRFRTMNTGEVQYRMRKFVAKNYDRRNKIGFFPSPIDMLYPASILAIPDGLGPFPVDCYKIFTSKLDLSQSIDWHKDLITGKKFPLSYSHAIDTRTERHGIVKVVWEINRLQFLTNICLQYRHTGGSKYLQDFIHIIQDWKNANPYLIGVNWYSNIEINLRIITWFLCWEILDMSTLLKHDEQIKDFVDEVWLPLIRLHAIHCERYISEYSSANNHRIAEATGLFVAGAYWQFPEARRWTKRGASILEAEMANQHSESGINREEASEYIQFIADFFLIAHLVGDRTSHAFSAKYLRGLKNIIQFIYHLMDMNGGIPYYGDDDDGHTFVLANGKYHNNFQSLLISGAIIFQDELFKAKGGEIDVKNRILFGNAGVSKYDNLRSVQARSVTIPFLNEGHFFIKNHRKDQEIYIHVDAAPLGYLSIAAHGHADALSFRMRIDGNDYFTDPGTYTYHSEPEWRAYFKGTLAHNTIRIDGIDQATNAGPCLWLDHYKSIVETYEDDEEQTLVKASHDGYHSLGIVHQRSYLFDKKNNILEITDTLNAQNGTYHSYEIPFHLHPKIEVAALSERTFELSGRSGRKVKIILDPLLNPEIIKGSTAPILGWHSPSFLRKVPTNTIYSQLYKKGSFQLKTIIKVIST